MLLKLVGAGILAAVTALIVRQVRPDYAVFVQLGGVAVVCALLLSLAQDLLAALEGMLSFAGTGGSGGFSLLAKALGICVTTQIAADVCRDSGSTALANIIELAGRLLVLSLALPLLKSIAELAVGLIHG
ncbi:MAG: stage III sporulation AC/AD family protein [Oscillospiraceae bacterium]|jgi:stage III sporulation protein AD|nr:stage III sporulation AC/AD family protein [Oscillospiraceae bacterium]